MDPLWQNRHGLHIIPSLKLNYTSLFFTYVCSIHGAHHALSTLIWDLVLNANGTKKTDLYHGGVIGWIEKGKERIVFVRHINDNKKEEIFASLRAKRDAKERLLKIIDKER
ncbi:MAG: hypothetical protein HEEMFOPI_00021 [Holosporales bacterium]